LGLTSETKQLPSQSGKQQRIMPKVTIAVRWLGGAGGDGISSEVVIMIAFGIEEMVGSD
jgi:hypothetical protein